METGRLEQFKKERENVGVVRSVPIDASRAKFEVTDRTIKGYAIVWGVKNDYNEIVLKGATQRSIEARGPQSSGKNKIVVLHQHRQSEPLARVTVLQEDDYGLWFEAEVTEGVTYCEDALRNIRAKVLEQLSYGFNYIWDKVEWDSTEEAYILAEINLREISVVTFSADENAQLRSFADFQKVAGLDAFTPEQIDELKNLLSLRTSGNRDEHSQQDKDKHKVTIF